MKRALGLIAALFLCLPSRASAQAGVDLQYRLSYVGGDTVHVSLLYKPFVQDRTTFTYGEPRFGGQADILDCLKNVQAASPATIKIDARSRTITLDYPGLEPVSINYDIRESHMAEQAMRGELFRPMIRKDYFYGHGVNIFLNPAPGPAGRKARQSVQWEKKPPFPLFYPFDPENRGETPAAGSVDSFLFSPITGARDLTVDKIAVGRSSVYLVLRLSPGAYFNRERIREYVRRYYAVLRRYWRDDDDKPYSLILQPFLGVDYNIGGVAFGNGFLSKYADLSDTILTPDRFFNLSHETGHRWLGGGGLNMGTDDQWFSEGFNDFVTLGALLAARYAAPSEFEFGLNDIMQAHYASPVKNTPNADVFKNYWKMGDDNKLPYRRGALFAFYLDNRIGLATDGGMGLRDLLLALAAFRKGQTEGYELTLADFVRAASIWLPADEVRADLAKYIIAGDPIPFSQEMLLPIYQIAWKDGIPNLKVIDPNKLFLRFSVY
ncbi:MAG: hypothetical protein NTZ26_12130 [Candidatus Aminicenantes bacterium]|nr:hypothetical protein [Candidatus Aminicenantes bacterium]